MAELLILTSGMKVACKQGTAGKGIPVQKSQVVVMVPMQREQEAQNHRAQRHGDAPQLAPGRTVFRRTTVGHTR